MNTVTITRRSRKFGWAVNASPVQEYNAHGDSFLTVPAPEKPEIEGTIKTIFNHIENDPFYKSLQGGTYYSTAFFVNGKRINTNSEAWLYEMDRLIDGEIDSLELPIL